MAERYFTTKEAAMLLGLSEYTIRRLIKEKSLIAEKSTKSYAITSDALFAYAARTGKTKALNENLAKLKTESQDFTKQAASLGVGVGTAVAATSLAMASPLTAVFSMPALFAGLFSTLAYKKAEQGKSKAEQQKKIDAYISSLKYALEAKLDERNKFRLQLELLELDKDKERSVAEAREYKKQVLTAKMQIANINAEIASAKAQLSSTQAQLLDKGMPTDKVEQLLSDEDE